MPSSPNALRSAHFRGDIAGLRTIAILGVVLIHAGVPWIPGGFTGVDVFFVISGFLITGQLARELKNTGRINLSSFWARRLRRLFPALAVVALATCIASSLAFSPLELKEIAWQAGAAILSISNLVFAVQAADYFGHEVQQSPFLHTWSLGVEEQFYIAFPLLLVLIGIIVRRQRRRMSVAILWTLGFCLLVSLGASIILTPGHPFWAFYTIPTRVWEFAAGGILAIIIGKVRLPRAAAAITAATGLATIAAGFLFIGAGQVFPGVVATIPVAGTLLVILGGSTGNPISALLGSTPMVWTGERSYSWYLWHWPAVVLASVVFGAQSVWLALAASVLALGLAHYTFRWVETPVREWKGFRKRTGATYLAMAGAFAVCMAVAGGVYAGGAVASDTAQNRAWLAVREQGPPQSCPGRQTSESGISYCVSGPTDAATTVMIVGDSHAAQWVPTMSKVATEEGFGLVIRSLDACPAADVKVLAHSVANTKCDLFHEQTAALIRELRPAVLVTANSNSYLGQILDSSGGVASRDAQTALWRAGFDSLVETARAAGAVPAVIEDTPRPGGDAGICVTRPGGSEERCTPKRDDAVSAIAPLRDAERSVQKELKLSHVLTFDDHLCTARSCIISDNGIPVFTDSSHLSQAWAASQEDEVRSFIAKTLDSTGTTRSAGARPRA